VAEKKPISDIATCGIYWYKKGCDFVKYAHQMIEKNIKVNNEFYIAPVYNELLEDKKKLIPFYVNKMWGLGTPEDLKYFIKNS
jgi:dTDP-glucose pyrophosphorylase